MPDNIKVRTRHDCEPPYSEPSDVMDETSFPLQAVPLSIDQHRQLMVSVLADQRVTELQQRGGAWLAGLTNSASGLAQRSPDCRYHVPNVDHIAGNCSTFKK